MKTYKIKVPLSDLIELGYTPKNGDRVFVDGFGKYACVLKFSEYKEMEEYGIDIRNSKGKWVNYTWRLPKDIYYEKEVVLIM